MVIYLSLKSPTDLFEEAKIIHKADSRGSAEHGWLHSFHTFSFADYYDRERMGFGKLWVLNDDVVQAGQGFGTHSHDNMEIISIPLSGSLRHEDSMGNSYVIRTGEIQVISAGSGITHSEFNNSDSDEVNFLQIWVMPAKQDVRPHSDQKYFDPAAATNRFQLVVSPDGRDGSLVINQDAYFSLAFIGKGETVTCDIHTPGNGVYYLYWTARSRLLVSHCKSAMPSAWRIRIRSLFLQPGKAGSCAWRFPCTNLPLHCFYQ